ncbi:MAG: hypothetical protein ACM3SO_09895 [Betaproteobacteria bacterium]
MKKIAMPLALLTALSLSAIAAEPETEAVEFYNRTLGHYFITATASEAKQVDDGAAGPGWVRTGRSFQAWLDPANAPANASSVCRFYSAGANSHFYTADANECEGLKQLEAAERDRARSTGAPILGWQYEGIAFRIESPAGGTCPAGTVAVSRVYNNGFATGEGSNHRFVDDSELRALMVDRSWISEGVAFCSRSKPSGTNANLAATTSNFDAVAGSWSGTAEWEKASGGTHERAPMTLDVSSSGAVQGSGRGCSFSGQLASGDGFRSLFTATLVAAGCSDAAFNGTYRRFDLERYSNGTLLLEAKLGNGASEASIEATLASASAPVPPPPSATPSAAGVTGDWSGTVGWTVVRQQGGASTTLVAANRPLSLSISSAGAVSGSGFGCTFSGSLAQTSTGGVFGGSIQASGCGDANFNGTFANVKVKLDDRRLEVELERESQAADVTTKVSIDGSLANASAAPGSGGGTPTPPPAGITGSFSGTFTASIEVRDRTSNATTTTSTSSTAQFTVTSGGALSGSGFGCTFAGSLSPSSAVPGVFSGTVSASGCTNASLNGSYAASAHAEDSGALSLEMQAETESGNLRTKVDIKGTAARS